MGVKFYRITRLAKKGKTAIEKREQIAKELHM
jgi:hypothetical protein